MNYVTNGSYLHIAVVIFIFGIMILLTYLAFSIGEKLIERIGRNLIMVIGKIMGLILGIIGTGMVIEGIKIAFGIK